MTPPSSCGGCPVSRPSRSTPAGSTAPGGIVDAVLGTGATGPPREPAVIEAMNRAEAPVVAADVPSGVDASTGEVAGPAVRAVATATFHQAKPGLWIHPGKAHAGVVEVIGIGIPEGAPVEPRIGLILPAVLDGMPRRSAESTKFSSGNVYVLGGSPGLTGAPTMAALAAMRTGAGYVTVGAPASLEATFTARPVEAMMRGLPDDDGGLTRSGGRAGAGGDRPCRRSGPRPGARPHGRRAGVRAHAVRARRGPARRRRRRPERARRCGVPRSARAGRPHPARGRAGPAARRRLGRGRSPQAVPRARGGRVRARSWC